MEEKYNDYELIYMAKEENEDAINILYQKYKPLILKLSQKYYQKILNSSLELSDLEQECYITLNESITQFNEKENTKFYTYTKRCIENRLVSIVRKETNEKHIHNINSISLNNLIGEDNEQELIEIIDNNNIETPEESLLKIEEENNLFRKIINYLSDLEECVITLKIQNYNYKEIAAILDKDEKSIDNSIQRIRTKLKKANIFK